MLEDIYVPLCLLAFLSGIIVILIIQQLARGKSRLLNILGVLSGIVLASATFVLAIATIILAANSKAQIGEARAEFETNQRPWVYPDLGPPAGPLSFDQNGAKLTLNNVGFHNTGQTPAISVFPIGILVFDSQKRLSCRLPELILNGDVAPPLAVLAKEQSWQYSREKTLQTPPGDLMPNVKKSKELKQINKLRSKNCHMVYYASITNLPIPKVII